MTLNVKCIGKVLNENSIIQPHLHTHTHSHTVEYCANPLVSFHLINGIGSALGFYISKVSKLVCARKKNTMVKDIKSW